MSSVFLKLLNLPAMFAHLYKRRKKTKVHDPSNDLELALYATIFGNNFLHYGYFKNPPKDPESISMADIKKAMNDYAELLVDRVKKDEKAIELGCGMGGLLTKLDKKGVDISGLTPDLSQIKHINKTWSHIKTYNYKLEDLPLEGVGEFDVVINSESFQYVDMQKGMKKVDRLLKKNGRWIMSDYFRLKADSKNKSGHILSEFETQLTKNGFKIVERVDITKNTIPTLQYGFLLANNLALPVAKFSAQKFFLRHSFLEYLFAQKIKDKLDNVRLNTLDEKIFIKEKIYLLLTIERI